MHPNQRALLKELIERKGRELASDPAKAREWLYKLGTHNADGTLTRQYGGESTDANHPAFSRLEC
jgi:hypothetical protein